LELAKGYLDFKRLLLGLKGVELVQGAAPAGGYGGVPHIHFFLCRAALRAALLRLGVMSELGTPIPNPYRKACTGSLETVFKPWLF
jgi:hypothetical protein